MNNYFDHNNDFSKGYRILDKRYIGVWSYLEIPSPAPPPAPAPAPFPAPAPAAVPFPAGLPTSGAISLNDIQDEFGGSNPIGINEYYGVATGVPASGTISFDDFYGTSADFGPVSIGYFFGGDVPGPTGDSRAIYKIAYSNDTLSTIPNNLPTAQSLSGAVQDTSNSYIGGGLIPSSPSSTQVATNNIMKFQFSNETASDLPANLPVSRAGLFGVSSQSKGYWCGGFNPSPPPGGTYYTTVNNIQFSNTTISTPPNSLPVARGFGAPLSTTSTGYLVEGTPSPPTRSPAILKLQYSTETFDTSIGTTPISTRNMFYNGAFSDRANENGYFFGGFKGPGTGFPPGPTFYSDAVEKIVYSTDTMSLIPARTPIAQRSATGNFSDGGGYISGGLSAGGCEVQKFIFSTETFGPPLGGFTGSATSPQFTLRLNQSSTQV